MVFDSLRFLFKVLKLMSSEISMLKFEYSDAGSSATLFLRPSKSKFIEINYKYSIVIVFEVWLARKRVNLF